MSTHNISIRATEAHCIEFLNLTDDEFELVKSIPREIFGKMHILSSDNDTTETIYSIDYAGYILRNGVRTMPELLAYSNKYNCDDFITIGISVGAGKSQFHPEWTTFYIHKKVVPAAVDMIISNPAYKRVKRVKISQFPDLIRIDDIERLPCYQRNNYVLVDGIMVRIKYLPTYMAERNIE